MSRFPLAARFLCFLCSALAGLYFAGCGDAPKLHLDETVTANLQAVCAGETNTAAKYRMYAEKAAAEGYVSVAALFRAAAAAENIHAKRQQKILLAAGVRQKIDVELPAYAGVAAALDDAIRGERIENETMYPAFLRNARAKKAPQAVIDAFAFANEAEKEHAKFFVAARADLKGWKTAGKTFYVCTSCGYTSEAPVKVCPLCAASGEEAWSVFR